MEAVFEGRRRLLPRPTDLSFFNWVTQSSAANHTPTFQAHAFPCMPLAAHAYLMCTSPPSWHKPCDVHTPRIFKFYAAHYCPLTLHGPDSNGASCFILCKRLCWGAF